MDIPHWASKVWVSNDGRFAYHIIPKNASMSFRQCGLFGKARISNMVYYKDLVTDHKNIAVFRHPVSRSISAYTWLCGHSNHAPTQNHIEAIKHTEWYQSRANVKKSFRLFSENLNTNLITTRSQVNCLKERGVTVDDIHIKFTQENLQKEFNQFKREYRVQASLPNVNVTNDNVKTMLKQLVKNDEAIRGRILEAYADDVELYDSILEGKK